MLAMLFEMTSTFNCWAAIPVAAVRSACIIAWSLLWGLGEPLDGGLRQVCAGVHDVCDLLVGPAHLDELGDLAHRLDIGVFQHALAQHGGVGGLRLLVRRVLILVGAGL